MKCPNCSETLVMSERQGVEIDYCPKCRGVWLDRGELDKIIEKSTAITGRQDGNRFVDDEDDDDRYGSDQKGLNQDPTQQKRKRRGGFLGDFFDFD
jgi:uncharacterized protein